MIFSKINPLFFSDKQFDNSEHTFHKKKITALRVLAVKIAAFGEFVP